MKLLKYVYTLLSFDESWQKEEENKSEMPLKPKPFEY